MKNKLTTILAALAALTLALSGQAAEKKKKAAEPAEASTAQAKPTEAKPADAKSDDEKKADDKPLPYQGKVSAADAAAKTFTTKTLVGKEHVFAVTDKTQIIKEDGTAGTFDDIKVDERVRGTRMKQGENKWEAVKVMLGAKPAKPEKVKKDDAPAATTEEKK